MAQRIDYFSDESLRGDLKGKTVRGGAYTLIAQFGQMLMQMAALPILDRLLTPADFGLVDMVTEATNSAASGRAIRSANAQPLINRGARHLPRSLVELPV